MVFCPFPFPEQPASRGVSGAFDEVPHRPAFNGAAPASSGCRLGEVFKHRLGLPLEAWPNRERLPRGWRVERSGKIERDQDERERTILYREHRGEGPAWLGRGGGGSLGERLMPGFRHTESYRRGERAGLSVAQDQWRRGKGGGHPRCAGGGFEAVRHERHGEARGRADASHPHGVEAWTLLEGSFAKDRDRRNQGGGRGRGLQSRGFPRSRRAIWCAVPFLAGDARHKGRAGGKAIGAFQ